MGCEPYSCIATSSVQYLRIPRPVDVLPLNREFGCLFFVWKTIQIINVATIVVEVCFDDSCRTCSDSFHVRSDICMTYFLHFCKLICNLAVWVPCNVSWYGQRDCIVSSISQIIICVAMVTPHICEVVMRAKALMVHIGSRVCYCLPLSFVTCACTLSEMNQI